MHCTSGECRGATSSEHSVTDLVGRQNEFDNQLMHRWRGSGVTMTVMVTRHLAG